MSPFFTRLYLAFTLSLLAFLPSTSAYAFDPQSVLKKYQTYAQENGIIFTFESAEKRDGNSLIITNADYYDEKTKQGQEIESMILGNVNVSSGGTLTYDTIEILNFTQNNKVNGVSTNVSMERLYSDGLKFSDAQDEENIFWPVFVTNSEVSNIRVAIIEEKSRLEMLFPSATVKNARQTSLRNFISQTMEIAPSSGTIKQDGQDINFTLATIAINDIEHFGIQGFDIGLITAGNLTMNLKTQKGEDIAFSFNGLDIKNLYLPDLSIADRPLVSEKDLIAEIKPLTVTIGSKAIMGWKRGFGKTTNNESTNTVINKSGLEGLYFDFTSIDEDSSNAEVLKTLKDLDLIKMVLNIQGSGSWVRDSGLVEISDYKIELEDGAAFGISARISGYTEEVARNFSTTITAINSESDQQKKSALGFKALAYLSALTIERLELNLDDQSLLNRVVNVQAAKLKQEPDQIKGLVGPMTNILLTPFNIPELAAQASQALGIFIQGNKKLTIVSEPENGIAVTELIALTSNVRSGAISPADIAKLLNITIKAE